MTGLKLVIEWKTPEVIAHFLQGVYIDIKNKIVFSIPRKIPQIVIGLGYFLRKYNFIMEDVVKALDKSLVFGEDIRKISATGPKLRIVPPRKWVEFCDEVVEVVEKEIGINVVPNRNISILIALIENEKIDTGVDGRVIGKFKESVEKYCKYSYALNIEVYKNMVNGIIGDNVLNLIGGCSNCATRVYNNEVTKEQMIRGYVKYLGRMVEDGLLPLNYRDRLRRSNSFIVDSTVYNRILKYIENYEKLSVTCKYIVFVAMRIFFRSKFDGEFYGEDVSKELLTRVISNVTDSRIDNLARVMISLDY